MAHTGCLVLALQETSCCNSPMDYTQQRGQSSRTRARKHSRALGQSLVVCGVPLPQPSSVSLYAYGCFACMYVWVPHVCRLPMKARKDIYAWDVTRFTGSCEPPCGHWELNLGLLQERQLPLTTEPSLSSLLAFSFSFFFSFLFLHHHFPLFLLLSV